jgi:A/G-specific adenine glycosylase
MLQQTNVGIVIPIYQRFLKRFPTVHHLANASIESVQEITDQLGYTRRGIYLHNIAKEIVAQKNGDFPDTLEELLSLKGIGRYTAGAILSFAFEKEDSSSAIVDVNVERVFSRIFGYWNKERNSEYNNLIWSIAEAYVASGNVWKKNQAIMDLGAVLCVAKKPKCYTCPMTLICDYYRKIIPKIKPLDSFFT